MFPAVVLMMLAAAPMPQQQPAPPNLTAPAAIGRPHSCVENQYPISALQTGTEGKTEMAFTISPQGNVANASVAVSSGNADLDAASLACASTWTYRPATKNGEAVASPWLAQVVWRIHVSPMFGGIAYASYRCITADDAVHEKLRKSALHTVVRVHFAHGTFDTVAVVASSGDPDLDENVRACYANLPSSLAADIPDGTDELFVGMLPPND